MRFVIDAAASTVRIEGSSTLHPVHAEATGLTGWLELQVASGGLEPEGTVRGHVEIPVERLRSGNRLVDRETRRRIDASRHPAIVGDVVAVEAVEPRRLHLRGTIAFRGETNDVSGAVDVTPVADGLLLEGAQTFDVRDWGLEPPRLLTLRVHPEVRVSIRVHATEA